MNFTNVKETWYKFSGGKFLGGAMENVCAVIGFIYLFFCEGERGTKGEVPPFLHLKMQL